MPSKLSVYHIFVVFPEETVNAIVGPTDGDEREMYCLERRWRDCRLPAVSLLLVARGSEDAKVLVETVMRKYGRPADTTICTDLEEGIANLQEQGIVPVKLHRGWVHECPGGFLVSGRRQDIKRAWHLSLRKLGIVLA